MVDPDRTSQILPVESRRTVVNASKVSPAREHRVSLVSTGRSENPGMRMGTPYSRTRCQWKVLKAFRPSAVILLNACATRKRGCGTSQQSAAQLRKFARRSGPRVSFAMTNAVSRYSRIAVNECRCRAMKQPPHTSTQKIISWRRHHGHRMGDDLRRYPIHAPAKNRNCQPSGCNAPKCHDSDAPD